MVVKAPKSKYSIHSFQASRKVYLVHLMSKVYPYSNYLCLRLAIILNKDKMIGLFFFPPKHSLHIPVHVTLRKYLLFIFYP